MMKTSGLLGKEAEKDAEGGEQYDTLAIGFVPFWIFVVFFKIMMNKKRCFSELGVKV